VAIIYLALPLLTESSDLPEDLRSEQPRFSSKTGKTISLFDLASGVVCHASIVTNGAVGSYPAFSPLPREINFDQISLNGEILISRGSLFSVALSIFRNAEFRELPGTLFYEARTFLPQKYFKVSDCPDRTILFFFKTFLYN